jgi:hypothetical protein
MRRPGKQSSRTDWSKPQKRRAKPPATGKPATGKPATGNKRLAEQIRRILGKHYMSKYRVR